ncbi:prepilin-type N-terminal cleavage/methylation domain-containing protein [Patescibacteria group bacterium]|nr:prepilin-type N-terminal cleavage/methylation domain-containing protein [Patescibacteria group bacterium]MBU4512224.1 prepilin-type N-terminal cleavage/methylation domain-containing protein [Patescibacteria group bacterium]MCG2692642.1 prepilin-type N-terminal cleavage/methylation domain-containing protein [Candidatus Parcubacteria bacterium]
MNYKTKTTISEKQGFTLIELLVVISIIAMLFTASLAILIKLRLKARDMHRVAEIDNFHKLLEVCYSDQGNYPDSFDPRIWDRWSTADGWRYSFSCGACHGNFQTIMDTCSPGIFKDPINKDPWAYYYFYFEPDATNYGTAPINDICKGHYALMAHLETPNYEKAICFDEPKMYEYWIILGY